MKLLYAVMWNSKDPSRTWSGTGYFLYKALLKKCHVEILNTMPTNFEKLLTTDEVQLSSQK
ncbi:MAG TPA: hypothetical protein GXX46_12390 [Peptococcaceae bacterium]|nr:hypothetical protein [Peptococcaceae bacterium]